MTNITERQITLELTGKRNHVSKNKINLPFDYCVIATGSRYNFPFKTQYIYDGNELPSMYENIAADIQNASNITIVGAGGVGVELFGEIASYLKETAANENENENGKNKTLRLIDENDKILSNEDVSDKLREKLMDQMIKLRDELSKNANSKMNLQVILNERLNIDKSMLNEMNKNQSNYLISQNGEEIIILCTGSPPINSKLL